MTNSTGDGCTKADSRYKSGRPKWTVMVFMGADGVEGNTPLAQQAADDIAEMEKVGSDECLNIFVQLHGVGDPVRHHIGVRKDQPVPDDERDLADGLALTRFVDWALDESKHQPSDHSILVLWGHAYRFGIGHTETRAGIDAIDFAELADVLERLQRDRQKKYRLDVPPKLDVVGFDACDLATVEMAVQLQRFAKYLLASQIGIPLPGWPYDRILERLKDPKGSVMGPAEFGSYVVRRYCEHYQADKKTVSLTLLDLQRTPEIAARTEVLALRLASAMDQEVDERRLVSDLFRRAQTDDDKPFVDVADLCLNLLRECRDVYVRDAAERLGDLLISPRPAAPSDRTPDAELPGSEAGVRKPFVAEHGRNTCRTAKLHGVSLYAPHVADGHAWEDASHWYKKFVFVQQTLWSGLVHALAQAG